MTIWDVAHPDEAAADRERFAGLVRGEDARTMVEQRYVRADGEIGWLLVARALACDEGAAPAFVISQMQDITDAKRIQDQLVHQASHDQLTGLPNRVLLLDRLDHALARSARTNQPVAVLFCDLDRFKVINDSLGHEAGDRVLLAVADRMTSVLRVSDTAARVGGDEFVIVSEDIDFAYAMTLADRVRTDVQQPLHVDGHQLLPTVSIGIAMSTGLGPGGPGNCCAMLTPPCIGPKSAAATASRSSRRRCASRRSNDCRWNPSCAQRCGPTSSLCTTSRSSI